MRERERERERERRSEKKRPRKDFRSEKYFHHIISFLVYPKFLRGSRQEFRSAVCRAHSREPEHNKREKCKHTTRPILYTNLRPLSRSKT